MRTFIRVALTALMIATVIGSWSSPVLAAGGADLTVASAGSTITAHGFNKQLRVTISNHGPEIARGVVVTYDLRALDRTKIDLPLISDPPSTDNTCHTVGPDLVECPSAFATAVGGRDFQAPIFTRNAAFTSGSAGTVTISVRSALADPRPGDNSVTVELTVGVSGVDLTAFASDIPERGNDGLPANPPRPGATATLFANTANEGDLAANGIVVAVHLPDHVAFAGNSAGCAYGASGRDATCTYPTLVLQPINADFSHSSFTFRYSVRIAPDAPVLSDLLGGMVTTRAVKATEPSSPLEPFPDEAGVSGDPTVRSSAAGVPEPTQTSPAPSPSATATPSPMVTSTPRPPADDVDRSDNSYAFIVFVGGPTLPATGTQAGLYGALGLASVLMGLALVLIAPRRRTSRAAVGKHR